MSGKIIAAAVLLGWFPSCFAVLLTDTPKQAVRTVSSGDMLQWGVGLLLVLAVFFFSVWVMRKLTGMTVGGAEKMRVVGGLSLGMRERVILLQVGKKQLVLGITPGRIEALHVLEGDDCLHKDEPLSPPLNGGGFAQKLAQAMKGAGDD
ncbi:MAG: flagellar biosynthetic protein FliO [Methylobacter sp.]